MKIRTGFVSNSSSSSFVLIGERVNINSISEKFMEDNTIIVSMYGEEGPIMVEVENMEELDIVRAGAHLLDDNECNSYVSYFHAWEDGGNLNPRDLPDRELEVFTMTIDQDSPSGKRELFEFFENYDISKEDINKRILKLQRKEKLNQIENGKK